MSLMQLLSNQFENVRVCQSSGDRFARLLAVVLVWIVSAPVMASDGRLEINQAAALAGGITPTDLPGFPVTLDAAGSYQLTGNLVVTSASTDAILISAVDVALDLGGFSISGPGSCTGSGSTLDCSPAGSGIGINTSGASRTSVRNGTVQGFSSLGISAGEASRFSRLLVRHNGGGGILGGTSCLVEAVRVEANGGDGIELDHASIVVDSTSHDNLGSGVKANFASVMAGNATKGNGGDGLAGLFGGNVIRSNTAAGNGGSGVRASDGALVMRNLLQFNLTRNLFLNSSAGYALNVVTSSAANPTTVVGGVNMGGNLCDNGPCP
jgi:hypothetical protein